MMHPQKSKNIAQHFPVFLFWIVLMWCGCCLASADALTDESGNVTRKRFEWQTESSKENVNRSSPASTLSSPAPNQNQDLWSRFVEVQKQIREHLSAYVSGIRDGDSARLIPFLLLCMLYGMVHAVGPGHGKTVVAGYFLARKGSWKQGALLGACITLAHVSSAVILLYSLYGIVRFTVFPMFEHIRLHIEKASYVLLILTGISIIVLGMKRMRTVSHVPTPHLNARASEMVWLALITGLVPCPAVALVVLFCLLQGLVWQGIIGAAAIAVGMAFTNMIFGLLVIATRRSIDAGASRFTRYAKPLHHVLSLAGGSIVLLLGLVLFLKV